MSTINVWDKVNLSIDQVSQLTGVKKTTLRYWEKEFSDYLKPERTETKRRQYSVDEVEKVSVLKQLIEEEKYKSAGVRLKLGLDLAAQKSKNAAAAGATPMAGAAPLADVAPLAGAAPLAANSAPGGESSEGG